VPNAVFGSVTGDMVETGPMSSFNDDLMADFRAHGGKASSGPFLGRPLLLLTTVGARSGESRTVPLVYTRDGERYVIIASKGGAPTHPAWYHNLLAHPTVTLEVGEETFKADAGVAEGAERRRLYDAQAAMMPAFAGYELKTDRVIPVITLVRRQD
jgi:deazaflavin-dependent oxidoreductase (nitroreductase family)